MVILPLSLVVYAVVYEKVTGMHTERQAGTGTLSQGSFRKKNIPAKVPKD